MDRRAEGAGRDCERIRGERDRFGGLAGCTEKPRNATSAVRLPFGGAFGFGLVVALRAISGLEIFQTEQTGYLHVIAPAITAPFGFLIGLGCRTTGSAGPPARRPCPRTTRSTAPTAGATTSSTPTTR